MRKLLSLIVCLTMGVTMLMAQGTVQTGRVISAEDGEPIIGASVKVDGTTNGTVTDANGEFSVKVSSSDKSLTISYIGMESLQVGITPGKKLKIVLSNNDEVLDEVMVVAYGTAKKSSFTGSAKQLKADAIESHVSTNVTNSLAGATAGVQLMTTNGDPADNNPKIRIRGIGSMSASNTPLYIVDGMPYSGSISSINPQDVESMTVLKDAAANAIYGARGANGVILITTKKGKSGEAKVRFDAKFGSNSRLIPQYDIVTAPGEYYEAVYARIYNTQLYAGESSAKAYAIAQKNLLDANNGGVGYQVYTVPTGQTLIGSNGKLNPNAKLGYSDGTYYYTPDDWYDETFHNSFRQEYNFSVSGGTDKISTYLGLGFLDDGGIVKNSNTRRYTARSNVEYQAKSWLRFTSSLNYSHTNSEQPGYDASSWGSSGNLFYITNDMGPIYPLYVRNADGSIKKENGRTIYDSNQTNQKRPSVVGNAVRDNEVDSRKSYRDNITGKWGLVLTPVKGLTLTANLGMNVFNKRYNRLYSRFGSNSGTDGGAYVTHTRSFDINSQYIANYQITLAEKNNIDVMVGYEQYQIKDQYLEGYNTQLYNPFVGELGNATGTTDEGLSADSYTENYMTEGIIGRVQYNYNEKYFLSGSFRRDASSRFAPGHQWGNFGSAGAAWLLNKEAFMADLDWIDELKLKASYGVQGNDNLLDSDGYESYYPYATMYDIKGSKNPNGTWSYSKKLRQQGNDDLTWETSKAFNAGIDFGMFKGRLNGTVEYFSRLTSDLLYYKPVPTSSGISTGEYPVNVGEVLNNGIEVDLNGIVYKNHGVEVDLNLNLTHYKNEIKKLDASVREKGIRNGIRIYREGGSLYQAYMYKFAGVDQENGMALFYKENADGSLTTTNQISAATQFDCGTTLPKLFGGFGFAVKGFGFDLTSQFQFQLGGKYYDGHYQSLMWTQNNVGSALHKDWRNAWTPEHPTNNPRWANDNIISQSSVDCFQISSNYLSVNNVTLGYTVPAKLTRKMNIESLRLYVAGENLGVATKRKGIDPRSSEGIGGYSSGGSAAAANAYASMRTITGGLSLTF
ncbi:MAG: SusC/RagA family TonB-linked outer membrane protein [Bacteroidaceae bacterium]|nr:SusC/RagA family TonB-linked outer membrane protein [Bacteroidaceae bacterium]